MLHYLVSFSKGLRRALRSCQERCCWDIAYVEVAFLCYSGRCHIEPELLLVMTCTHTVALLSQARFIGDEAVYKNFLEILNLYRKGLKSIAQVYTEVSFWPCNTASHNVRAGQRAAPTTSPTTATTNSTLLLWVFTTVRDTLPVRQLCVVVSATKTEKIMGVLKDAWKDCIVL